MAGIVSRQNGKLGGRPKGSKSKTTLERLRVQESVAAQIMRMANKLIRAQSVNALGTHKMVTMVKELDGSMSVETIRNEKRMDELFEKGVYGKDYLIVAAADPDWKAADALLNRALGKPTEHVDHTSGGDPITGFNYIIPETPTE